MSVPESGGALFSAEGLGPAGQAQEPAPALGTRPLARQLPVARVAIDTRVPHLDRLFDYAVPADLDHSAQPGTRVRIVFNHREQVGWLIERVQHPESAEHELSSLQEVVSPVRALTPETWELVRAVAERSAGLDSDVLRLAVPPRAARIEKQYLQDGLLEQEPSRPRAGSSGTAPAPERSAWEPYSEGFDYLASLADPDQEPARAVVSVAPSAEADWADMVAQACLATVAGGRRALVVVPDLADLDRMEQAVAGQIDGDRVARLTQDQGQSARYEAFLRVLGGQAWVVLGTRSAAFAPVPDLGLVCCHDDGDHNLIERQAPYFHARDVLLLRAREQGCSALFTGYAVTPETQRLVLTGWARYLSVPRPRLRELSPVVRASSDSYQAARDPLAAVARIPHLAYETARAALTRGPVLIQVARTGYAPALACQRCRSSARCPQCHGPLSLERGRQDQARCRWCRNHVSHWSCAECGNPTWRLASVGSLRTVEELGRAFPQVPVVNSSGESVKRTVPAVPSIVVATPGAEPRVPGGYAAALLLDGDRMMARDSLRAAEEVLRVWTNACALVRPRSEGGEVVCTAEESAAQAALVRWDPAGFAARELAERSELRLPPAVRSVGITGPRASVERMLQVLMDRVADLGPQVTAIPAAPVSEDPEEEDYRAIVFMAYAAAPRVTTELRAVRASFSAARSLGPVQIRCDAVDLL